MIEIKNGDYYPIQVRKNDDEDYIEIYQGEKCIGVIDKQAAPQLIEILKEFVGDQKTIPLHYYPEYDETIDYLSDALVRHNGEVKLAISIKGIC